MANEYKLSYTAKDIDLKLGKIEEIENSLENKQDKLTFDVEPAEGSENPITSGGVYNALQNVGGGTDLVAGDFIEIKDGVVRCTFGDVISGELKEEFEETYGTHALEMGSEEGLYMGAISMNEYGLPSVGDVLEVVFTPSGETTPTKFTVETTPLMVEDGEVYIWSANCNATLTLDMEFTVIDDTKPAFVLAFNYDDGDLEVPMMMIASATDYTGATLTVGTKTITDTRKYVLLPDNALGLGREIVTEVDEEIVNVKSIEMDYSEENGMGNTFFTLKQFPEIGSTVDVYFTPSGETEPVHYTAELVEFPPLSSDEFVSYAACCNASYTEYGPVILDESKPAFILATVDADGNDEGCFFAFFSLSDYNGASIVVTNHVINKTRVTLPMEALSFNFDAEPTEGSTNLVNSGDLYNILGDIKTVIAEINSLVLGGAS